MPRRNIPVERSWVGASEEKKPRKKTVKPDIPLRYRIDPTAKKLDELDSLELELHKAREGMDVEDYDALSSVILKRRQTLVKKAPERAQIDATWHVPVKARLAYWVRTNITETHFKWLLAAGVAFCFWMRNF